MSIPLVIGLLLPPASAIQKARHKARRDGIGSKPVTHDSPDPVVERSKKHVSGKEL